MESVKLSTDSIALEDTLGRDQFAKQIANCLVNFDTSSDSMVIGICGKWGSGKSTLLAFIAKHIDECFKKDNEKYRIINFNPWANAGLEELQRSLLETIIKELENIKWKGKLEETNKTFKNYLKYLNYLKFVKHVHPVAEKIVDAIDDYTEKINVHSLEEVKKEADKLINEKRIKLYIFIDDIDRLSPEEITSVFKLIKLNINLLNTFYIIAYDKEVVIKSLNKHFAGNGESYLEKIIQVDFKIPEILEEQVEKVFFDEIIRQTDSFGLNYDNENLQSIWKFHGLKEYFRTLRDIKRYFNSLLFSLPHIGKEINIPDFIILEALKVFDHTAYEKIYYDFIFIKRRAMRDNITFDNSTIEKYPNPTTKSLLGYLFTDPLRYFKDTRSINAKRLRDPEFFSRYYTLYIPSKEITEDLISQFFAEDSNRRQILSSTLKFGKMSNFLSRLCDPNLKSFYKPTDYRIFSEIIDFWSGHEDEITSELDEPIWISYFNLAHSYRDKFTSAKEAIEALILYDTMTQPLKFIFCYFIVLFKEEDRNDSEIHGDIKERINLRYDAIKDRYFDYLKANSTIYLNKACSEKVSFITTQFVYAFARYCPEEYKKVITQYFENPQFNILLIKKFLIRGEQEARNKISIDLNMKNIFFPNEDIFNLFMKKIQSFGKGTYDVNDEELIKLFIEDVSSPKVRPIKVRVSDKVVC